MDINQRSTPEDDQAALHTAIANELIALTPEWWDAARLTVSVRHEEGTTSMAHEITSPEGHPEPVTPGDDLFLLTRRLYLLSEGAGHPWRRATYVVRLLPEGSWKYECSFDYD